MELHAEHRPPELESLTLTGFTSGQVPRAGGDLEGLSVTVEGG
jgi:hypothetical protein